MAGETAVGRGVELKETVGRGYSRGADSSRTQGILKVGDHFGRIVYPGT